MRPEWGDRGLLPRVVPIAGRERRGTGVLREALPVVYVSASFEVLHRIRDYNRVVRIREIVWLEAGWTVHRVSNPANEVPAGRAPGQACAALAAVQATAR